MPDELSDVRRHVRVPELGLVHGKGNHVHVDVDLYEPTLASLAFFYPRMNPGGVMVCDDYGFTTCPGATKAVDEFLHDKPEKMIALPNGGGFFIAGVSTAGGRPCDALEAPGR